MKIQISEGLREELIAYKKKQRARLTSYQSRANKAPEALAELQEKQEQLQGEIAKLEATAKHDDDKAVARLMELKTRHGLITTQIGKAEQAVESLSEPPMCGGRDLLMRLYQEYFDGLDPVLVAPMLPFSRTRQQAQRLAHQTDAWGQLWAFGNLARDIERHHLDEGLVERIETIIDRAMAGEVCLDFVPASVAEANS